MRTCILSHGRSGTLYTAEVMRAAGLDFGHEEDGKDGAIGGIFFKGERNLSQYRIVLHQVRNPLKVIASAITCKDLNIDRTFEEIGCNPIGKTSLERRMCLWLYYTAWADFHSQYVYRIENIEKEWPNLCVMVGAEIQPLPKVDMTTNHRDHEELIWEDLEKENVEIAEMIHAKSRLYGYPDRRTWNNECAL